MMFELGFMAGGYNEWLINNSLNRKKKQMTREEAIKIMKATGASGAEGWIAAFEALELIKFEEEKKINTVFQITNDGNFNWADPIILKRVSKQHGAIRLEEWPEGLVLWIGGEIHWRSWK